MIRDRSTVDLPGCVSALRAVFEADRYPAAWPADPAGWLTPQGLLLARVSGDVDGHVGLVDGEPPAALGLRREDVAWVSRLFVAPSARRGGLARALLRDAVAGAGALGRRAVLDVESGAAKAIALYEGEGWTRVHTATAEWIAPDGRPAVLHYYLSPSG
ncbi:GNAT family N-acetyltransferase [Actinorhabdospora filicis]|uniref:GNAT family N-acetyltransferase n=1 Tax=Actinorhabdospora filicis TaxID=1785913 RepID=A0A9W6SR53_9ACTN|nr:GNAT family N-acetyltransferase [Actinorhabdospora filicis]GLZ80682.1 GNAT family N-acetyltransferase [Actinorhabdospora filicis]